MVASIEASHSYSHPFSLLDSHPKDTLFTIWDFLDFRDFAVLAKTSLNLKSKCLSYLKFNRDLLVQAQVLEAEKIDRFTEIYMTVMNKRYYVSQLIEFAGSQLEAITLFTKHLFSEEESLNIIKICDKKKIRNIKFVLPEEAEKTFSQCEKSLYNRLHHNAMKGLCKLQSIRSLSDLELYSTGGIDSDDIKALSTHSPQIEEIPTINPLIKYLPEEHFVKFKNLRHISFSQVERLSKNLFLEVLFNNPTVISVNFNGVKDLNDDWIQGLAKKQVTFPFVNEVNLSHTSITSISLKYLTSLFPNAKKLALIGVALRTTDDLTDILRFQKMESFELDFCEYKFSDLKATDLFRLVSFFPSLHVLLAHGISHFEEHILNDLELTLKKKNPNGYLISW